jgi:leucine dehydrogenase
MPLASFLRMTVFEEPDFDDHEHVSFFSDDSAGLRAVIAIHRTGPLGTAGGGCRIWPYRDTRAALRDALRLSRAMTYKMALVEIPAGGAKAVVIGQPATPGAREALLLAVGRSVERLAGRFIVSTDVGTGPDDLPVIARTTRWVKLDESGDDTSTATAYGVFVVLRAAVRLRLSKNDLRGVTVAVQGLGRVGLKLCELLGRAGARLLVTDLDPHRVELVAHKLGATAVAPDAILDQSADVFAPCALADAITADNLGRLRCAVIAGSANNQLAESSLADELGCRDILWAPDIVANAGGVVGAASAGGDPAVLRTRLDGLGALLEGVVARAKRDGVSLHEGAERIARDRFRAMGGRP